MKKTICILIIFLNCTFCKAALLINEIACESSSGDWVELFLSPPGPEKLEIQNLYITMYYGTNEPLGSSSSPITLYNYDRPETPWDDRFAVVHLTSPGIPDETDVTGDTNGNGIRDIYCNNYFGSLWNTDCVVAIDTDDDPANGGIIDFVAYSNRDGTFNSTVESYIANAGNYNQWNGYIKESVQDSCVDIGLSGIKSFMSISRINSTDTNSLLDFAVTNYQTPGRENVLSMNRAGRKLFRPDKKHITIIPSNEKFSKGKISLSVFETCDIKIRIFSPTGMQLFESPLYKSTIPGFFEFIWDPLSLSQVPNIGMLIVKIEAVSQSMNIADTDIIFLITAKGTGRYR
jgi:hypothetical protein